MASIASNDELNKTEIEDLLCSAIRDGNVKGIKMYLAVLKHLLNTKKKSIKEMSEGKDKMKKLELYQYHKALVTYLQNHIIDIVTT